MNVAPRTEYTGNTTLDRIQASVRDLATALSAAVARIAALENARGVGVARVVMADTDHVLSPAELAKHTVIVSGTLTAARTMTVKQATDAEGYVRWISNSTAGGFAINVTDGIGTVVIPTGTAKAVLVIGTGPGLLT